MGHLVHFIFSRNGQFCCIIADGVASSAFQGNISKYYTTRVIIPYRFPVYVQNYLGLFGIFSVYLQTY